jgi:hypothetical protein
MVMERILALSTVALLVMAACSSKESGKSDATDSEDEITDSGDDTSVNGASGFIDVSQRVSGVDAWENRFDDLYVVAWTHQYHGAIISSTVLLSSWETDCETADASFPEGGPHAFVEFNFWQDRGGNSGTTVYFAATESDDSDGDPGNDGPIIYGTGPSDDYELTGFLLDELLYFEEGDTISGTFRANLDWTSDSGELERSTDIDVTFLTVHCGSG